MPNNENKSLSVYPVVITVADVMNPNVVSIKADTSIDKIVQIFTERDFTGIPVVSDKNTLLGIITQYELVTKGSGLHIPTLLKTLEEVKAPILAEERLLLKDTLKPLSKLVAKDVMNEEPLSLNVDAPLTDALNMFAEHRHANPIIIVNNAKQVVGVLSRHDMIRILALKELGKTIDTAITRTSEKKAEETGAAVTGVVQQIKKEFFFLPKRKATKWIILAVSLFIIGFISSVLFVAKLPDFSKQAVQNTSQLPVGQGAMLILSSSVNQLVVGQDVPVTVTLKTDGVIVAKEAIVSIKFDPDMLILSGTPKDLNPAWASVLKIIDLKNNSLIMDWQPANPQVITGGSIDLGIVTFKAIGKGSITLTPSFAGPRKSAGSSVLDANGQNILDSVASTTAEIL